MNVLDNVKLTQLYVSFIDAIYAMNAIHARLFVVEFMEVNRIISDFAKH